MPQNDFLLHLNWYVDVHHAYVVAFQVHVGINLDLGSRVRGIMVNRDRAKAVFKGIRFYPGFGNYDHGHCKASGMRPDHNVSVRFIMISMFDSLIIIMIYWFHFCLYFV